VSVSELAWSDTWKDFKAGEKLRGFDMGKEDTVLLILNTPLCHPVFAPLVVALRNYQNIYEFVHRELGLEGRRGPTANGQSPAANPLKINIYLELEEVRLEPARRQRRSHGNRECSQNAGAACFAYAASCEKVNFTTQLGSGDL
jgi:hypothetical protein